MRGLGIEISAIAFELSGIGIGIAGNARDARDAWYSAIGMIEKHRVAFAHLIAHEVTRLIVSNTVPCHGLVGQVSEVIYADVARFRFH